MSTPFELLITTEPCELWISWQNYRSSNPADLKHLCYYCINSRGWIIHNNTLFEGGIHIRNQISFTVKDDPLLYLAKIKFQPDRCPFAKNTRWKYQISTVILSRMSMWVSNDIYRVKITQHGHRVLKIVSLVNKVIFYNLLLYWIFLLFCVRCFVSRLSILQL